MAVDFTDTTGQYVDFGNLTSVVGLSQKSLLIWFYADTLPATTETLFEIYHVTSTNEIFFALANYGADSGKFGLGQRFTGVDGEWRTTNDVLATGINHVAVTYDAGSASNDPVIYYNGSSVAVTESATPTGSAELSTASVIRAGAGQFVNRSPDGRILSLCYYNRILSATEIADAYASKLAIPTWRGLVFAPQLWQRGEVGEGGTLTSSHTIADAVTGALGTPSGSPLFRGDTYLTIGR